jgi:hypothetical protein
MFSCQEIFLTNDEQTQAGIARIIDIANQCAAEANIKLSAVSFDCGQSLGCVDIHMLNLKSSGKSVYTKVSHSEIVDYLGRSGAELTKAKIRGAIERLHIMLESR